MSEILGFVRQNRASPTSIADVLGILDLQSPSIAYEYLPDNLAVSTLAPHIIQPDKYKETVATVQAVRVIRGQIIS